MRLRTSFNVPYVRRLNLCSIVSSRMGNGRTTEVVACHCCALDVKDARGHRDGRGSGRARQGIHDTAQGARDGSWSMDLFTPSSTESRTRRRRRRLDFYHHDLQAGTLLSATSTTCSGSLLPRLDYSPCLGPSDGERAFWGVRRRMGWFGRDPRERVPDDGRGARESQVGV